MIGLELLMWSCPQHLLSTPSIHGPPVVLEVVDPPKEKDELDEKETISHSSAAISFPAQQNSCMSVLKRFQPLLATCISSNLGHQGALLELAVNVATRWHYLHWL